MQAENRIGYQTIEYKTRPWIMASACAVGRAKGRGRWATALIWWRRTRPLARTATSRPRPRCCAKPAGCAWPKANIGEKGVQAMVGGDLLNQIMPSALAARELKFPFLGLYGACSTMSEGLITAA